MRKCHLQHNITVIFLPIMLTSLLGCGSSRKAIMYQSSPISRMPSPPPSGHLTFLKIFGQIPRYVGNLDGQTPHLLAIQKASNPPPTVKYLKIVPCIKQLIQM